MFFLLLSNLLDFFNCSKLSIRKFCTHSFKLDPDLQKINMDPQPWLSHYYTVNSGIFWILGRHFCILIYCAKFLFYLQVCVEYGSGRLSAVSRRKDLLLVEYGYPRLHRVLKCLTQ